MNISQRGLDLILSSESFVPYLYDDPENATVAIGILVHYGPYHWDRGVCAQCDKWPRQYEPESTWITEEQGMDLLRDKANATGRFAGGQNYVGGVQSYFPDVNQNQFDALCSFAYNLGTGYLRNVAAVFYSGGDVCAELMKYVLPEWARVGLTRRRKKECELFNEPVLEDVMTPQELERLTNLELQLYTTRRDLNELANGLDGVSIINKWPLSLKGLWFVVGKAWPF